VVRDNGLYAYPRLVLDRVETLDAYWKRMGLQVAPSLNLNDRTWVIIRSARNPPVRINTGAIIRNSLITDGSWSADTVVERHLRRGYMWGERDRADQSLQRRFISRRGIGRAMHHRLNRGDPGNARGPVRMWAT
jgi:ADP-glucose pyrophosphorylase